ncbi:hypothetical protein JOB18_035569 [Solea senegalensis]|uniref:Uncharacterized protein n=1 Tax=Solea senegalensis TaxID=28829 RepID=A0AAV6QL25_SOLSE|nr:hypothetical protein JOB18_035569 [Solea senegalensis]
MDECKPWRDACYLAHLNQLPSLRVLVDNLVKAGGIMAVTVQTESSSTKGAEQANDSPGIVDDFIDHPGILGITATTAAMQQGPKIFKPVVKCD